MPEFADTLLGAVNGHYLIVHLLQHVTPLFALYAGCLAKVRIIEAAINDDTIVGFNLGPYLIFAFDHLQQGVFINAFAADMIKTFEVGK